MIASLVLGLLTVQTNIPWHSILGNQNFISVTAHDQTSTEGDSRDKKDDVWIRFDSMKDGDARSYDTNRNDRQNGATLKQGANLVKYDFAHMGFGDDNKGYGVVVISVYAKPHDDSHPSSYSVAVTIPISKIKNAIGRAHLAAKAATKE